MKSPCSAHAFEQTDNVVEEVKKKFDSRSRTGIEKYGTTLEDNNLAMSEWLNHLQEELMDATLYVQKLKSELQSPEPHVITRESWDNADKITHNGYVYVRYTDLVFQK